MAAFVFLKLKIDSEGETPISPDDLIAPAVRVRDLRHAGGRWGISQQISTRRIALPISRRFVSVRATRLRAAYLHARGLPRRNGESQNRVRHPFTDISKFGKKFPAIVVPTIHRRGFRTIAPSFL